VIGRSLYFKNVTILNADGPAGSALRVRGGHIQAIDGVPGRKDCIIDGQGGLVIPGLINAHDHLELNTFKRLKYRDSYTHALQWIEDIEARFDSDPDLIEPRRQPLADRLFVSAVKNLLSGATTVCQHNPFHRQLRRNYPIRVVKHYGFCHSLFRGERPDQSFQKTNSADPWIIHLAEGINARAEAEFEQLNELGVLSDNTVLVHGVGLTAEQRRALAARGGGLVWCPGSNFFMFGQTAQVKELAQVHKLALGSDSRLSGEVDLLAELKLAAQTQQLSSRQLFRAVTTDAARVLRIRHGGRGQIRVDREADLVLLPRSSAPDPFSSILNLRRVQLELVMLGGKPLIGSVCMQPVFKATRTGFAAVTVDGIEKLMAMKLVDYLKQSSVQEAGVMIHQQGAT